MIRYLVLFIGIIICSAGAYSQSNLAILKYEEAETAFAKADYAKTLSLVDEVEQLNGVTSSTLFLKIVTKDQIFSREIKDGLNESGKELLRKLRRFTGQYLKAMESQDLDDNFRTVYSISEKLKQYPEDVSNALAVLERFYEAIGGRERARTVQTVVKSYETTSAGAGVVTSVRIFEKNAVGKCRWEMSGEGFTSLTVFNKRSNIAYNQIDMAGGGQTKLNLEATEGVDRRTLDSEALVFGEMVQPEKYVEATVEERVQDGQQVYVLQGNQQIAVFSKDSGLLLHIVEQSVPNIEMTIHYKDYRSVNGLLFPFATDIYSKFSMEGVETVETTVRSVYTDILVNVPIADSEFR